MYRNGGNKGLSPTVIFLLVQLYQQVDRLPVKPPVTIALLAINIAAFVLPNANVFGYDLTNINQNCVNPSMIISRYHKASELSLNRVFLSSIIHADDMHLYYNMLSLCWKGINLEANLGSGVFLQLVLFSLFTSHIIMIILAYTLNEMFHMDSNITGYRSCAVGFSAVLFALKYVLNYQSPTHTRVMGISVPTKYAAWLELVTISMFNPSASLIGHLSGILAGMIYIHTPQVLMMVSSANTRLFSTLRSSRGSSSTSSSAGSGSRSYTYSSGTAAPSSSSSQGQQRYPQTRGYGNQSSASPSSSTVGSRTPMSNHNPTRPTGTTTRLQNNNSSNSNSRDVPIDSSKVNADLMRERRLRHFNTNS